MRPDGDGRRIDPRAGSATGCCSCCARWRRCWPCVILVDVGYQLINNASPAINRFGLGFLGHTAWKPNFKVFGARLDDLRDARELPVRARNRDAVGYRDRAVPEHDGPAGSAARWSDHSSRCWPRSRASSSGSGVSLVFAPFIQKHIEPALHSVFGFIPLFGPQQTIGNSLFAAGLILDPDDPSDHRRR